jgi:probable rRNA maturation factor
MAVEIVSRTPAGRSHLRSLKRKARRILALLKQGRVELSLALVADREIRRLNARYRKKDYPTDVLSFPPGGPLPRGARVLGDVVISVERAKVQANESGKTLGDEMESLLIHGILHLLGHDHERSAKEAKAMQNLEKKIRRALCQGKALRV